MEVQIRTDFIGRMANVVDRSLVLNMVLSSIDNILNPIVCFIRSLTTLTWRLWLFMTET